jgi:hypothetical protein
MASVPVSADAAWQARVTDDEGQAATTPEAYIQALRDRPPVLDLTWPTEEIITHPLGEILFQARLADDYGLDRAEVVCRRVRSAGESVSTYPMSLARRNVDPNRPIPDAAQADFLLALESLDPPAEPEEVLLCHVQAYDRKGQMVRSDMRMVTIGYYETWQTFFELPDMEMTPETEYSLWAVLRQAWEVHRQADQLPPKQLAAQCLAIADTMIDPETGMFVAYYDAEKLPEDKLRFARAADGFVATAHAALERADTGDAVEALQQAVAQLTLAGLSDTEMLLQMDLPEMLASDEEEQDAASLAQLLNEMEIEMEMDEPVELSEEIEQEKA